MVHTDRGAAYCSMDFNNYLTENKCVHSMSHPEHPWENSPMERWRNDFKHVWMDHHPRPANLDELETLVQGAKQETCLCVKKRPDRKTVPQSSRILLVKILYLNCVLDRTQYSYKKESTGFEPARRYYRFAGFRVRCITTLPTLHNSINYIN